MKDPNYYFIQNQCYKYKYEMQFSSPKRLLNAPKKACVYFENTLDDDTIFEDHFYDMRRYRGHLKEV